MAPEARGGRFGTVTWKLCCPCSPPGSVTVTVTDAFPGATARTVMLVPDMDAVATLELEELTEKVSMSPFGSLKHAEPADVSPAWMVTCGIAPQEAGGWGLSQAAANQATKGG